MSFGKMTSFIEILAVSHVKDAEGFIRDVETVAANVRAAKEERQHPVGKPCRFLLGHLHVPAAHDSWACAGYLLPHPLRWGSLPTIQCGGREGARHVLGGACRENHTGNEDEKGIGADIIKNWYSEVYEPTFAATPGGDTTGGETTGTDEGGGTPEHAAVAKAKRKE